MTKALGTSDQLLSDPRVRRHIDLRLPGHAVTHRVLAFERLICFLFSPTS